MARKRSTQNCSQWTTAETLAEHDARERGCVVRVGDGTWGTVTGTSTTGSIHSLGIHAGCKNASVKITSVNLAPDRSANMLLTLRTMRITSLVCYVALMYLGWKLTCYIRQNTCLMRLNGSEGNQTCPSRVCEWFATAETYLLRMCSTARQCQISVWGQKHFSTLNAAGTLNDGVILILGVGITTGHDATWAHWHSQPTLPC